jgi:3-hydroxyacyl-[acyl-carrier-protein] dehydratase
MDAQNSTKQSADFKFEMPMLVGDIKKLIPHRFPFLLIDRITEYVPQSRIVALKNVSYTEQHLQGHFPDNPIMPGVLQVEALAQASAVFGSLEQPSATQCLLTEISSTRFRRQVIPGDQLLLTVTVKKFRNSFFWFAGAASVEGQVTCECEFSAKVF